MVPADGDLSAEAERRACADGNNGVDSVAVSGADGGTGRVLAAGAIAKHHPTHTR